MKKLFLFFLCTLPAICLSAQSLSHRLQSAFQQFVADSQMRNGISSLYVIDAASGEVIFDKNSHIGLVPASTQKIITSVTAFEVLGSKYRYPTQLAIDKRDGNTILSIYATGDPTFGSWRWDHTSESSILKRWVKAIQRAGIKKVDKVFLETGGWETETIPDGWIWQDIGNYYGAGASVFNWRENQYDIIFRSGQNIGDPVSIIRTVPALHKRELVCHLRSAAKGSGDNAYVYYPFDSDKGMIRGTIPIGETNFKISAALPSAFDQFFHTLADTLKHLDIKIPNKWIQYFPMNGHVRDISVIADDSSPPLDSIIYWFNKKSINLYGEALIKTIAVNKTGFGVTDSGIAILRKFWKDKGIHPDELNMYDGSGLSPLNRVTTRAQVKILKYARDKEWFQYFYDALPEYNGMRMKSGTISDVKGFCGYHRSKDGKDYIFSFLVNNYGGRSGAMVSKMYKVLDELK